MLRNNRIHTKLLYLCEHPLYGNLLRHAVKVWNYEFVHPGCTDIGIVPHKIRHKYRFNTPGKNYSCTIIGASILNKKAVTNKFIDDCAIFFDISKFECELILTGYSNYKLDIDSLYQFNQSYLFGRLVAQIVF